MQEAKDLKIQQMISLQRLLSKLSKEDRRLLASFLLTSYGMSMVIQGRLAVAKDQAQCYMEGPSTSRRMAIIQNCLSNISVCLTETQDLAIYLGCIDSAILEGDHLSLISILNTK